MNYSLIVFQKVENVAVIKFNRPDLLNSFNRAMALEVQSALAESAGEKSIRAVLITGEGKAFCAGQDLAEAAPKDAPLVDLGKIIRERYNPIIKLIREIEKPVICAVNGTAAGAGANIALACDVIVASGNASFIQAFSKIGLIPDSGGTFFLPRIVGLQRASVMMMLSEKISAEDALKFGMIYKIFPLEKLFDEALGLANQLAEMPTKGLALTKKALNKSLFNNLDGQLKLEEELQIEAGKTFDYQEGVKAFLEKRKPNFKGE